MNGRKRISLISKYAFICFMLVAGLNHFIQPQFYLPLIPDYIPYPGVINLVSGFLEVVFALFLLHKRLKRFGGFGIIILLLSFIPSHIYFIAIGACIPDGLCTPIWLAWIRLVIIHPLLIFWAWNTSKV